MQYSSMIWSSGVFLWCFFNARARSLPSSWSPRQFLPEHEHEKNKKIKVVDRDNKMDKNITYRYVRSN